MSLLYEVGGNVYDFGIVLGSYTGYELKVVAYISQPERNVGMDLKCSMTFEGNVVEGVLETLLKLLKCMRWRGYLYVS